VQTVTHSQIPRLATGDDLPTRVVVGVDGTPASDAALEWAVAEAEAADAPLLVCHAYTAEHIVRPLPHAGAIGEAQARQRLDAAVMKAARKLGWRRVQGELRAGDPAGALIDAAPGARMLVVGSHGDFGQVARVFGSTSMRVAGRADCPAVVVRPLFSGGRGPFAGHVVVGVDGAGTARAALKFGFEYAALHDLPLVAVHVSAPWPGDFWVDEDLQQTYFVAEPADEKLLSVEVEPWHHKFPAVPVKRAGYGGDPVRGLLRAAGGARLLVVGDRRRDSLHRLMLGSVSQGIAGHAPCPVAIVHQ
jgi:nucleotide-binding universal stress UspA family protein